MAHFAKISEDNIVLTVVYIEDKYLLDENGQESESIGQQYLQQHNNWPAHLWIKTSYNTYANIHKLGKQPYRGNYASIGAKWFPEHDSFSSQKPFLSWQFSNELKTWIPPIPKPNLTEEQIQETLSANQLVPLYDYVWNESNQTWDFVQN